MQRDLIASVLMQEGGFVNHPADRGGVTNWGITQATLAWWRGRPVTVAEVRELSKEEAGEILLKQYVENPGFKTLNIPDYLLQQIIDFGVNSGPQLVIKKLQEILNVEQDGILGPLTKNALEGFPPQELNNRLVCSRLKMIGRIIVRDKSQAAFAQGWINRACSFFRF